MQSIKNKKLRVITGTGKEVDLEATKSEHIFSKIAVKLRSIKMRLFPEEDLAQLHLESQNLKSFKTNVKAQRSRYEAQSRIFMFNR